jgi:hypothetical protein
MEHADAGRAIQREVEQSSPQSTKDTIAKEPETSSKVEDGDERIQSVAEPQPQPQPQHEISPSDSRKPSEDFGSTDSKTAAKSKSEARANEGVNINVNISTGTEVRRYPEGTSTNSVTPPSAAAVAPVSPRHSHSPEDGISLARTNSAPSSPDSRPNRKRGVPHVYRDYSNVPDTAGYVRKKTGGVTQPFPEKLHELLERENEPSVISWLPHGRAFLVRKPKEFTNYVMPK